MDGRSVTFGQLLMLGISLFLFFLFYWGGEGWFERFRARSPLERSPPRAVSAVRFCRGFLIPEGGEDRLKSAPIEAR